MTLSRQEGNNQNEDLYNISALSKGSLHLFKYTTEL